MRKTTRTLPSRATLRAIAARILRGSTDKKPVLCVEMARAIFKELGQSARRQDVQLSAVHLQEELTSRPSDLRVVVRHRRPYVILAEWATTGQDVLFKTGYDGPPTREAETTESTESTTSAPIKPVARTGGRHSLTILWDDPLFDKITHVAHRHEWSLSHAVRVMVRDWQDPDNGLQ